MRIYAYIDGFNFYHGLTKETAFRWCNLLKLCQHYFPKGDILRVKLFAAHSKEFPDKPGASQRQNTYIQALKTLPNFDFIPGKYIKCIKKLPLNNSPKQNPEFVEVRTYKEKGSDVNLATQLITDGIDDLYDMAAIFTNDSDLIEPIRIVRYKLNKKIYLLLTCNFDRNEPCKGLQKVSNYHKLVSDEALKLSQFENIIIRPGKSAIIKPINWQ